jgi:hypothetical protein
MSSVDALLDALRNATDDAERATLLDAAPEGMRRKLRVRLDYRRFMEGTEREVEAARRTFVEFTESLDVATDDTARLSIVRAADRKFLAEWNWHQTATDDSRRKRYLQAVRAA